MNKITTIVFDNHGVITSSTKDGAMEQFARFLGVGYDEFERVWDTLEGDVDGGKITNEEFLRALMDKTGSHKDIESFRRLYFSSYYPIKDVQEFAKKLGKKYEIVLLTNFSDAFDEANKRWKLEKIFGKKIFVSGKLKMRKPHEDIYLYTLKKIGKKAEETVFIDDNPEFIETAKRLGMHTILFKNLKQVEKDLDDILEYQT